MYVKNRIQDAADIFTFEVQSGSYGASARVGPLKAGFNYKDPSGYAGGLRGGYSGRQNSAEFTALVFGSDYHTAGPVEEYMEIEKMHRDRIRKAKKELEEKYSENILYLRNKEFRATSPFGTKKNSAEYRSLLKESDVFVTGHYFTQIEFSCGAYFGLKVGVNPGEILDFIAGFFFIDIYRDDAPYPDMRIRELQKSPYWQGLDSESREKIIQKLQ